MVRMNISKKFLEQNLDQKKIGIVTIQDFEAYYSTVSINCDTDDYFEGILNLAWNLA